VYQTSSSLRPLHFPSSAYINVDIDNHVIIFASDKGFLLVAIRKKELMEIQRVRRKLKFTLEPAVKVQKWIRVLALLFL